MAAGMSPSKAAQIALAKIIKMYPNFSGAVVAVNMQADHGKRLFYFAYFIHRLAEIQLLMANFTFNKSVYRYGNE